MNTLRRFKEMWPAIALALVLALQANSADAPATHTNPYVELVGMVDSDEAPWGSPDTSSTLIGGSPGMTITRLSSRVTAGTGGGNANIRCTDGTNTCNCAISCTASGDQTWTCTGGGGTGCTFTGVSTTIFCSPAGSACTGNPASKDISIWGTHP